ncbi:uncharacterized protein METZ01_LOCUS231953 [marine metagenome]|uniref:Ferric uptake regulation protein n=1 Tax=marine metagenome TaxID=408172 RepID=A0A382GVV8_9ZZZZ
MERSIGTHLSAEDIFRELLDEGEEIGLATGYRVLTQFEQSGICIRHNFDEGKSIFELTPVTHHDHMVCIETGKIIEFNSEDIEIKQVEIAKEYGYEIVDHKLVLYVKPNKK